MTTLSPPSRNGSGVPVPKSQRVVLLSGTVLILLGAGSVGWLVVADPTGTRRDAVLAGALAIALVTLISATLSARTAQRRAARSAATLRSELERATTGMAASLSFGDAQLRRALEELRQGRPPKPPVTPTTPADPRTAPGPFGPLVAQLEASQLTAYTAVVEAAGLTVPDGHATKQVGVLVNLSRRLQSLVHQGIEILDELEQQVEDADLLRGLFEVDHIATRIRRYVENVAVLGGEVTRRQWRSPVPLDSVVRSAIGEVERYSRVKPLPPIDGRIDGSAVADVVHLLAELIENATTFSPPETDVNVRTQKVTTGVVVEIEDRGLGQEPEDERMRNALLANPERVELGPLLRDGRVGLYVVAVLARQHQIRVELRRNLFGGVTSLVLLPNSLLSGKAGAGGAAESTGAAGVLGTAGTVAGTAGTVAGTEVAATGTAEGQGVRPPLAQRTPAHRRVPAEPVQHVEPVAYAEPVPYAEHGEHAEQAERGQHARAVEPGDDWPARDTAAPSSAAAPVAPVPATPAAATGSTTGSLQAHAFADRPALPQRIRQTHMAPQLQQQPPEQYGHGYQVPEEAAYTPANPGLMATYRRGVRAAEAAEAAEAGGTAGSGGTGNAARTGEEQAPYSDEYSAE